MLTDLTNFDHLAQQQNILMAEFIISSSNLLCRSNDWCNIFFVKILQTWNNLQGKATLEILGYEDSGHRY